MHVPQERLDKAMFPMWFRSVCAWWLPFTLNKEQACKQGFLTKVFMLIKCIGVPFLCSWRESLNDVFGLFFFFFFWNSSSLKQGLGESPTLFEAWSHGICRWFRHQWLTKCSMSHDQSILSDQWGLSLGYNVALGLIRCLKWRILGSKILHVGDYLAQAL